MMLRESIAQQFSGSVIKIGCEKTIFLCTKPKKTLSIFQQSCPKVFCQHETVVKLAKHTHKHRGPETNSHNIFEKNDPELKFKFRRLFFHFVYTMYLHIVIRRLYISYCIVCLFICLSINIYEDTFLFRLETVSLRYKSSDRSRDEIRSIEYLEQSRSLSSAVQKLPISIWTQYSIRLRVFH